MVKELNNMKNKKSNSYKPYDTSNSFVRRVTSRVTQLLPQPTSWLSRFLAREPEQAGPVESQQGEDEEVVQPPPSKRMRTVQTCTDFPMHHNSVATSQPRRLEDRREEELSPIRSYKFPSTSGPTWLEDPNVAGPSGLNRHRFVASTPAVVPESHAHQAQQPKVNGDDGSDSDSGSHASSLQPEVQPSQSLFRTLNLKQQRPSHRNATDELNNSLLRSKQLKLDLSSSSLSSSRGRVSFDTTVFNSPFKGRLCGGLSASRDESITESPFYRSNTTFGGASSCNDSLLRTRSLHSEVPIVIQPSPSHRVSDNLGSSTKKILKALEQFSTPLLNQSRRIQPRDRGVKRKSEVPYKELVIPQMPDLLRIKRRDARQARQSSAMTSSISSSNNPVTIVPSTKSTPTEVAASESSSSQLSQRLSKFVDNDKEKSGSSSEKRVEDNKKVKESPSLMTGLPLTSLPKFDSGLVKPQPVSTNISSSAPLTIKSTPSQFTFSKPIDVANNVTPRSSIPLSKVFSEPLDPNSKTFDTNIKPVVNCVNATQPKGVETMTYFPPSNSKLKKKEPSVTSNKPVVSTSELKTGSVLDILNKAPATTPSRELKSGSVLDVLKSQEPIVKKDIAKKWQCDGCYVSNDDSRTKCAACEQPKKQLTQSNDASSRGFGDKFKITSNEWECKSCFVRNNVNVTKCVACEQVKPNTKPSVTEPLKTNTIQPLPGFGDKFKPPAGSWECSSCLVQNKSGDFKCISCSSNKPGAPSQSSSASSVATATPLSNLFKKPEGSWECDACLVRNKSDITNCISCGTLKKGAKASQPTSTFSFGIPPSTATSKFSFGVSSTSTSDSSVKTTSAFTSSVVPSQNTTPTFTFGIPSSATENKTLKSPITNSMFSSPVNTNNVDGKAKVAENAKVETEKVVKPEQPFTFGVPNKESAVAAVTPSVKSIFGNVTTSSVSTPSTSSSVTPSATSSALPIFVNQISSTKSPIVVSVEKTSAPAPSPIFTFGSSTSLSAFGKSGAGEFTKPTEPSIPVFSSNENDVNPMVTSPVSKTAVSNSVLGTENNTSEAKTNIFQPIFGSNTTAEKKPFLNSNAESPIPVFSSSSVNSFSSPSTSAPVKPVFTFNSGFPAGADANPVKTNSAVNSFSSQPIQQQSSATEGGFNFKPESTFTFNQKKSEPSTTPFQFSTPASNHANNFSNAAPTNQFNSGFGSAASSPFSTQGSIFGSPAPQPAQTASFLFGASQTNDRPPPAPTFNFAAQSGSNNVGNTSVAGGFAFGQTPSAAPVQPPAFDPNVKPVFNFSGGQTPIFSATAAPGAAAVEERKIRKAFRRTTQK